MKTLKLALYAALIIAVTASISLAGQHTFMATLSGGEFTPVISTAATGEAVFTVSDSGNKLAYTLTVKNITNVAAAHIHHGRKGVTGGHLAGLFGGPPKKGTFSGELASGTITDKDLEGPLAGKTVADLISMLKKGEAYVNVHTAAHPKGELRGQIE